MKSEFSQTLGTATKELQTYLDAVRDSLSSGTVPPAFPSSLADNTAALATEIARYSGHQATYAESRMNREIEALRGVARASAVAGMSRADFYASATTYLQSEVLNIDEALPVSQAIVDASHPAQTGELS